MTQRNTTSPRIAVIGAGMSGLLAGIKLHQAGYRDFRIFEKADRVGGTWRDNTYPGLTCDVPSQHYCYSFELSAEWSRLFSPGPEIQAYFEAVCAKYALTSHIAFGHELCGARWQDGCWQLAFANGAEHGCDVVIAATGVLHHPVLPDIAGRERFAGHSFHTARWDHAVSLSGRRVGIIGTGSTAIQIVPAIIDTVAQVTLFQRTAQWILPLPNPPYSEADKAALRADPARLAEAYHAWSERFRLTIARAVVGDAEQMAKLADACRRNLEENVADPALRARLTPDYAVACKRLVMSDQFYPAIQHRNATLETTAIAAIEPAGVRLADGRLHELDVLVYATGFDAHRFVRGLNVCGVDGVSLDAVWADAMHTHRSLTVPGFPNFFMMVGPNSPIGNFSLIMVAEHQIGYILQLVELLRDGGAQAIEPKPEACAAFNDALRDAMGNTVWVSGCRSWYLDRNGQPILWPWSLERFQAEMAAPDLDEYAIA